MKLQEFDSKDFEQALIRYGNIHQTDDTPPLSPELKQAFQEFAEDDSSQSTSSTNLIDDVRDLVSKDTEISNAITDDLNHPSKRYGSVVGLIGLGTAVVVVLQTYVHFKKNPDGTWSLEIKKQYASNSSVNALIKAIANKFSQAT